MPASVATIAPRPSVASIVNPPWIGSPDMRALIPLMPMVPTAMAIMTTTITTVPARQRRPTTRSDPSRSEKPAKR